MVAAPEQARLLAPIGVGATIERVGVGEYRAVDVGAGGIVEAQRLQRRVFGDQTVAAGKAVEQRLRAKSAGADNTQAGDDDVLRRSRSVPVD